jgi:Glycyl-tRNA synthetase, beta subunit
LDKKFLEIPEEILIITMQHHQKYFHTFDQKGNITNEFFVVANVKDNKGFIKIGNERVVDARLSDASFFWEKNKSQNLIKQISKIKSVGCFAGLGSFFVPVRGLRRLGALVSAALLFCRAGVALFSSVCRLVLFSAFVSAFPSLLRLFASSFSTSPPLFSLFSFFFLPPSFPPLFFPQVPVHPIGRH